MSTDPFHGAFDVSLAESIFTRRSRRVGLGMTVPDGPLAYTSPHSPVSLDPLEEAFLVWLGTGVTGLALCDLPTDGIAWMHGFSGRSWPCSCNSHSTELFYTNDEGIFTTRLGEDTPDEPQVFAALDDDARRDELVRRFRSSTTKLADGRADLPTGEPGLFGFNAWNANQPGSTLFIPVTNTTVEYMTLLFIYFDEINRFNVVDELNGGRSCGLDKWKRSGRVGALDMSLMDVELRVLTSLNVEGAFICQNMALAAQALGLGGWTFTGFLPHHVLGVSPAHAGLGFRFVTPTSTPRHAVTPVPVGKDGVFESLTPPYVANMAQAVEQYLDCWSAASGKASAFDNAEQVMRGRPYPTDETIEIVTAFCTYVHENYGRFPAFIDPMFVRLVFQAHHLDVDFYDQFYRGETLSDRHRHHMERWHGKGAT